MSTYHFHSFFKHNMQGEGSEPTMPHGPCRDTPSRDHAVQVAKPQPLPDEGDHQINEDTELIGSRKPKVRQTVGLFCNSQT